MPFGAKKPRDDGHARRISAAADELHTLVEQGDHEGVRRVLRAGETRSASASASPPGSSPALVDAVCSRTGMTPLLKAVEGASEETVRALLEAGADVRPQVSASLPLLLPPPLPLAALPRLPSTRERARPSRDFAARGGGRGAGKVERRGGLDMRCIALLVGGTSGVMKRARTPVST